MTLTASRLWKRMTAQQRLRAAHALWRDEDAIADQRQAVQLIAQQKKFRLTTVSGLDDDRKAGHLASVSNLPEALATRLLISYHIAEQRPMMGAFLDAVGIAHTDGVIQADTVTPDPGKIVAAAAALARDYPAHDVSLYLSTLLWQDPVSWGALQGVPEVTEA